MFDDNDIAIPRYRPVLGSDLSKLAAELKLSTLDALYVFGINMPAWAQIVNKEPNEPVKQIPLALLARFLSEHPEACPVPTPVSPEIFFESMASYNAIAGPGGQLPEKSLTNTHLLSVLLGRNQSAGYRWLNNKKKDSGATRPVIQRYLTVLDKSLSEGGFTLREMAELAETEYRVRQRTKDVAIIESNK